MKRFYNRLILKYVKEEKRKERGKEKDGKRMTPYYI